MRAAPVEYKPNCPSSSTLLLPHPFDTTTHFVPSTDTCRLWLRRGAFLADKEQAVLVECSTIFQPWGTLVSATNLF
jgi:hypothetical protein